MTTMDEMYGDGSDCIACDQCGFCKTCGDCICKDDSDESKLPAADGVNHQGIPTG